VDGRNEENPILGKNPSVGRLDGYGIVTSIGHYYLAKWLPQEDRKWFQYITIGGEVGAVWHNYSVGIRVQL
jgi:hypothetical protein